jgi:putative nucleotidyltransferase with HDIG domain
MKMPKKVLAYIGLMGVLTILLSAYIIANPEFAFPSEYVFSNKIYSVLFVVIFWSLLAILSESFTIVLPNGIGVSVSFSIYLASIIVGGPLLVIITAIASYVFCIVKLEKGYSHIFNIPYYKSIFNVSNFVLCSGISGVAFAFLTNDHFGEFFFLPTVITVVIYIALNTFIMSELISLLENKAFLQTWLNNFKGVAFSVFAVGIIGIILALAFISYGPPAVLLFFAPLLLARYSFKLYLNMKHTYIDTISAFNKFLEAKDMYTSGHASRVLKYSELIGEGLHLSQDRMDNLRNAAILHDIGKIGIDDSILKKPSSLSLEEYNTIKSHVTIGAEIIDGIDFLKGISKIVAQHHERPDGMGYPYGLKESDICVEASILSIADVYDAMISDRPYRKGMGLEYAISELRGNKGTQFDPKVADIFINILEIEMAEIKAMQENIEKDIEEDGN